MLVLAGCTSTTGHLHSLATLHMITTINISIMWQNTPLQLHSPIRYRAKGLFAVGHSVHAVNTNKHVGATYTLTLQKTRRHTAQHNLMLCA